MLRTLGSGAAGTLLALALAGCGGVDPEPKFAPTPAATSSSPASPTPSPTQKPVAHTPEETVRAWVKARNVTVQTGDATEVRGLSASGCATCHSWVDPVVAVYRDGGHYETKGWSVAKAERDPNFASNQEVIAGVVYEAGQTILAAGADPVSYEVERHIATFRLAKAGGRWLIQKIVFLS